MMHPGVLHAQGAEKGVAQKILVRLAGNLFNNAAQEEEAGIAVAPFFSRVEIKWVFGEGFNEGFRFDWFGY